MVFLTLEMNHFGLTLFFVWMIGLIMTEGQYLVRADVTTTRNTNDNSDHPSTHQPIMDDHKKNDEEDDDEDEDYQILSQTKTDKDEDSGEDDSDLGAYIGAGCTVNHTCDSNLLHVICDPVSNICECEKNYPVKIGVTKGCAKPKKLGEQCFYVQACSFSDIHSSCVQINHNAICECDKGYHSVSYTRPTKRVFCTEDMALLTADVPTLLGVSTGIAVLTGLICFVLHLFSRARYPRPRHFADANLAPPILFSSETGIPLAVHSGRPSSRSSQRSSAQSLESGYPRRPSSAPLQGSRGVLVPSSRAGAARAAAILLISCHVKAHKEEQTTEGVSPATSPTLNRHNNELESSGTAVVTICAPISSRRPSLASVHSSGSSVRSYSYRRYEKEREQKEARQEMKMQLARMQAAMSVNKNAPIPSPKTPNSTDELLPSVSEIKELSMTRSPGMLDCASSSYQGVIGPCSSAEPY